MCYLRSGEIIQWKREFTALDKDLSLVPAPTWQIPTVGNSGSSGSDTLLFNLHRHYKHMFYINALTHADGLIMASEKTTLHRTPLEVHRSFMRKSQAALQKTLNLHPVSTLLPKTILQIWPRWSCFKGKQGFIKVQPQLFSMLFLVEVQVFWFQVCYLTNYLEVFNW